ncbi:BTB/POZ and MATH domain-containing protein 2-like [Triticum aestivum]|uniref:BTB/POZ and MATH domain-containing protein 2-like n=1 Tax=Triticum aestivum TaxID=4565 RepID=UPI001D026446|nr:BTB/POZ and MATH domain-containing protein 2-like [Triticum aestivum]
MANTCTNFTDTVRFVRLFKIDGFDMMSSTLRDNECITSRWCINGYEWEIHCYPPRWACDWVAVKLMLVSEAGTVAVRANLSCLLVHPVMQGGVSQFEKSVSHVFKSHKDCSNRVKLVQKSSIPAPAHPKDDYLIVQCTITVLKERTDVAAAVPVPASNLPQHFGDLLQRGTGADITFVVSGESFAAHKVILAARSPVLMAEFFGYMREASAQSIMIKDMEAAVFKAMLHFIYTDTVPELDRELEAVETMAQHLLVAADRYGLDRLKVICEHVCEGALSGGINVDTVATTLTLAEQHNCSHLKAKCVEFIISTPAILDAVVATEGYKHLETSCPAVLTSIVLSMRGRRN